MSPDKFHEIIDGVCFTYFCSVTSGHRTPKRNEAVGGVKESQHLGYKAVDIVLDDWGTKTQLIIHLENQGLFVLDEVTTKNHLHVDDRFNSPEK